MTAAGRGLLRYAEDQFLNGHLLSGWIVDYVDLEESLAVGSIAQEQLAHAALFLELDGLDVDGRDDVVYERPPSVWWPSALMAAPLSGWPSTVVRGLVTAVAGVTWTRALGEHAGTAPAARTVLAEQRLHQAHWARWVRLLGGDGRTREEIAESACAVVTLARDVFGEAPGMPGEPDRQRMHEAFVAALADVLAPVATARDLLPGAPTPRTPGDEQPHLGVILDRVRMLRVGRGDGVRGVYR